MVALVSSLFLMRTGHSKRVTILGWPQPEMQASAVSGSITGQVNAFTGTFSTGVPIEIPPGRNGLQPALALSYSSSGKAGVAGVGWDIPASSILPDRSSSGDPDLHRPWTSSI